MALHIDNNGTVHIITPPKILTKDEKKTLEEIQINKKLVLKAINTKFKVVYG